MKYIYIYIHTYRHTCLYIYIYTHMSPLWPFSPRTFEQRPFSLQVHHAAHGAAAAGSHGHGAANAEADHAAGGWGLVLPSGYGGLYGDSP